MLLDVTNVLGIPPPVQVPQPQFGLFQQGAHMHENQALREHCGILEAQVTKLSMLENAPGPY
ncbi:uncharacterized protein BJ212DRAFT_1476196 [Suillus subaureus]|uniref:Uncharacterized protein n=1 Tax=Suillus subaureus TaxID=48587 RepID=A0A9P7ELZ0_9AGAM|nr:uncharacterized protein BJ212DRAFT_1476196 [Suillus subaureus]KAG1824912.1 hypothetical protein BJ212DRAFT_1476196 [Suillus subaureus]